MENISLQQDSFETLAERFNELPLFNAASPERVGNFERFIITNAGVQDSVTWTEKAQGVINHLLPENAIATVRINTNGEEPSTLVLDIPYL